MCSFCTASTYVGSDRRGFVGRKTRNSFAVKNVEVSTSLHGNQLYALCLSTSACLVQIIFLSAWIAIHSSFHYLAEKTCFTLNLISLWVSPSRMMCPSVEKRYIFDVLQKEQTSVIGEEIEKRSFLDRNSRERIVPLSLSLVRLGFRGCF